ncbi:hypothetical protein HG530_003916 [Fusarium avenaceum]|nr:hypothetical protein HG530_003916 [Fusarium avenaceum]
MDLPSEEHQQIQEAHDIAIANGLLYSDRPGTYIAEHTQKSFRFAYGPHNYRFVLLPLSLTGIKKHELVAVQITNLPCPIWTVPIPAFCAAYLRIIMREKPGGKIYFMATADLLGVITYSMFDMSYEGSYMLKPGDDDYVVDEEKDALEMENAIKTIKAWNFSEDTEWARDIMLQLVSGTLPYESLPGMRGSRMSQE